MTNAALLAAAALLGLVGCSGSVAGALAKPPEYAPEQQTKCKVAKSTLKPLIIEWPAAERSALEAQTKDGVILVRYDGCEMELLRGCRAPGHYRYVSVTPKQDNVSIRDADELYATIPVHAASFEGKLARAGRLDVNMTIVGVFEAPDTPAGDLLQGDCSHATHVIRSLTVGAFEFTAGAQAEASAGAGIAGMGAGAASRTAREMLSRDGDAGKCAEATSDAPRPPFGCSALLRVEVAPLKAPRSAPAARVPANINVTPPPNRPKLLDVLGK